ncbi:MULTISPECIES: hypothetical protein [unclassified Halomonas]|uniref:hypothetical protein n=1 Tax=unclassified Halomonas TaxID=2609666 RepID=UPI0003B7E1FD|nr:hypothetical protein [Halomonas sp. PBN3]ERS81715.1 hypothetical protein Q671_13025 [Halomonas sp. PBN3]
MNRWLRKIDDKATSSVSPSTRWLVGWYAGPPHLKGKAHYFEDGTSLCGRVHLDTRHHRALNPDNNQRDLWCRTCGHAFRRQYWQRVVDEGSIRRRKRHAD